MEVKRISFKMKFKQILLNLIDSPWFIALILLGIFFIATGYKYGWDDQHLEIPLLKSLIDPSLFRGDYYVESLKKNFTSYFYPLLSRIITVEQIPAAYLFLYIISRYFLFFWIYKLWLFVTKDKLKAFSCVLVFILLTRVDEFLYRTFSHQEFTMIFIFAGIYYFFRERFLLSAALFGIGSNFHVLYCFFPMFYLGVYLLWDIKKHGFKKLMQCCIIFLALASPVILWIAQIKMQTYGILPKAIYFNWEQLYQLACPQNFIIRNNLPWALLKSDMQNVFYAAHFYLMVLSIFLLNICCNKFFRKDKKALVFSISAVFLLIVCVVFTYLKPERFFLDLNLTRNAQYLLFLMMGFLTIFIFDITEKESVLTAYCFSILFAFIKFDDIIAFYCALSIIALFGLIRSLKAENRLLRYFFSVVCMIFLGMLVYKVYHNFDVTRYKFPARLFLLIVCTLLTANYFLCRFAKRESVIRMSRKGFVLIPLFVYLVQFGVYHVKRTRAENTEHGFWRMQRSWEDMQRFVKANTDKDSVIFIPYNMEMCGFRILSERKVVVSYRDCGVIGFDYIAALEWKRRIDDVLAFKIDVRENAKVPIQNAILKYGAEYIVFLRYATPHDDNDLLERIYTNTDFALFRVMVHPAIDQMKAKVKSTLP
ncbi:MAG: hypothetical protein HQL27_09045 [Candidatus Omnitrophica bacterium]|nr:hypothetical protein [Candidatus Omnitrophota bacterium]